MFPFSNSDNTMTLNEFRKPASFQQNPISKDDPFFPNFPSPFFDEHELPFNQIFPQYNHPKSANPCVQTSDPTNKQSPKLKQKTDLRAAAPRKRTGKKDRHSKICTAQGIRDRRMRLSLQVARKFFDLQDLLGYDKASKTIEWLFTKSNKAIRALEKKVTRSSGNNSESECEEVVSGIEENSKEGGGLAADHDGADIDNKKPRKTKPNTRESREKARARARCRTEEKMMGKRVDDHPLQWSKSSPNRKISDLDKVGSSSTPFDGDDQERVSAYAAADYSPIVHQPSDVGTIEKLLGNSTADYHCPAAVCIDSSTNFMGFLGSWDLLSNDRLNYAVASNIQASMPGNSNSIYSATTPDFPLFHQ